MIKKAINRNYDASAGYNIKLDGCCALKYNFDHTVFDHDFNNFLYPGGLY